jgi:hypothetical protein
VVVGVVRVVLSVLVVVLPAVVVGVVRVVLLVLIVLLPPVVAHIRGGVRFLCFLSWFSELVVVLVVVPSIIFVGDCGNHLVVCDGCLGSHLLLIPIHEQVLCSNTRRRDNM